MVTDGHKGFLAIETGHVDIEYNEERQAGVECKIVQELEYFFSILKLQHGHVLIKLPEKACNQFQVVRIIISKNDVAAFHMSNLGYWLLVHKFFNSYFMS